MSERRFQVVLTDADRFPLHDRHRGRLARHGIGIVPVPSGVPEEQLGDACAEADGVLVFGTKLTGGVIGRMNRCAIVARCGIGYDNIDVAAAKRKGIRVTYVPDYCVEEVSDHTVGLMLDCLRKLSFSRERVARGIWDTYESLGALRRSAGLQVGLLGFGKIARAVARKLQGFAFRLAACDPHVDPHAMEAAGVRPVTFAEWASESDIMCVLLPLTPQTAHIVNRQTLEVAKPGAILVNTSRGALIDEEALVWALREGKVGAAGLDVLEAEPPLPDHPLLRLPQVVVTPHSAAFSAEAIDEVTSRSIDEIIRALGGQPPLQQVPADA
ncbi:MAG: C-terminal binding protein [Paenibacillaceae bacterium]|nr:C-terminal binding protein [Paenibacillaceae bacterium]